MTKEVFSEFEILDSAVKWQGEEGLAERIGCVGSIDETMNVKTITKNCEGIVAKQVTKSDGTGELKVSLHMKYAFFTKAFGMEFKDLKEGVMAYGRPSVHKHFCYTNRVVDEDGENKFVAYPNCVITNGVAHKVENGAEEVAEVELTIGVSPDEYGFGRYEALEKSIVDEDLKEKWLVSFTPELVRLATV